jgi:L-threonylcarbamoyladenylate synthase
METRVVKVDADKPDEELLKEAARLIKNGEVVAFPTETVYGLGADATNSKAVIKIFEVKNRPLDNPAIVHIQSFEEIDNVAREIPEEAYRLMKKFWPGPLTLILKRDERIAKETSAGLDTVAVRMPSHPVAQLLIKLSGLPIAAPSANKSGRPSPTDAKHVLQDFKGEIPLIIDSGRTQHGVESTVLDMTKSPPMLLRPGALSSEDIREAIGEIVVNEIAQGIKSVNSKEKIMSPGLKYRHYAPNKPLILVEGKEKVKAIEEVLDRLHKENKRVGLLISEENRNIFEDKCEETIELGSEDDMSTIAHNLFDRMREIDGREIDVIVAEGFTDRGIGLAVMNRLRKASSERIVSE